MMKAKILFVLLVIISTAGILAFQPNKSSPARSIFPVTVNPLACKENEIFYNMTTHQFLVCTGLNTLSSVSFGTGGGTFTLQAINTVFAGPISGSSSLPTFRALVSNDIPSLAASKITSGVFPVARLGTGTPDGTKFLRDDGAFVTPAGSGDMILASVQTITGAKTFNAGKLIVGVNSGAPSVIANSFYRDSSDGKLYIGKSDGSAWDEILEAGVSGPIATISGGNGLVGFGSNVASAPTISVSGKIFHVTGTTNIVSVSGSGVQNGSEITIIFDGILTFTDGSNLKLANNFVTTADDTITLIYDGTNFYEVTRSIN